MNKSKLGLNNQSNNLKDCYVNMKSACSGLNSVRMSGTVSSTKHTESCVMLMELNELKSCQFKSEMHNLGGEI